MSWADRYRRQARAWRVEAHRYASHGNESKARDSLDAAEVYERLADREESRPSQRDRQLLERQIAGSLRSTIAAHGPIRMRDVGSAAKRITGQIIGADALPEAEYRVQEIVHEAVLDSPEVARIVEDAEL